MTEDETDRHFGSRWLHWLAPTRSYAVWFAISAILGAAACFLPLFNLIGYESAALFGSVLGPVVVFLTLHAFSRTQADEPLEVERDRHPAEEFALLALRHLALLVPPAALLSLNALRVKNCDFLTGGLFWLLIPAVSILIGQTVGWVLAALLPPRRWMRNVAGAVVVLGSAAVFGLHLALQPPIVGHQWFLGYFSGSIYDEALALPESLVAYRGLNVLVVAIVLAAVEGVRRRAARERWHWVAAFGVLAAVGAASLWAYRQDLGIDIDRDYIESELGGRLETEHFIIHHPQTDRFLEQRQRLAEDHEYRYHEMRRFFETDPASDGKIHSYVYPNRAEKGRLMGARRTLVAKIWLGEMHILWPEFGHHWLAHELAHIFTAPFAATPLRLSVQNGVGVNMGLVEGIATAADWPAEDLTPHEAAAALRRLDMAPDLRNIVGAGGFWTQSSGRAYMLVGSFIRFLVERHGIETFKRAYGRGAFREAYGQPVGALVADWESFLDGLELSDKTMETARYLYRRPSIFEKVCARTTAELQRRANIAAARGDVGDMRRMYRRLVDFAPRNLNYRIEFAQKLMEVGDYDGSLERARRLLERDLPPVQRARLLQLKGDVGWHRGDVDRARSDYQSCLDVGLPVDFERLVRAKLLSLRREREELRRLAFRYLVDDHPGGIAMFFPMEWSKLGDEDPLAAYLVGRRLWQYREWTLATRYLRRAQGRLEGPMIAAETNRMLGRALYFRGHFASAARVFSRLETSSATRYRATAREWRRRIDWRRNHAEREGWNRSPSTDR